MTTHLHAHVEHYSQGCDGSTEYGYITHMNEAEIAEHENANGINDFSDLHFKARVLAEEARMNPDVQCEVKIIPEGFNTWTDNGEGPTTVDVTWCENPEH